MPKQDLRKGPGAVPGRLPLREHRPRARVTIEEVMAETKLSRRFLEAIEGGRYQDLLGGVFTVNYRQYAAMTGYDAEVILEHYRCRAQWEPERHSAPRQPSRGWVRFFESA